MTGQLRTVIGSAMIALFLAACAADQDPTSSLNTVTGLANSGGSGGGGTGGGGTGGGGGGGGKTGCVNTLSVSATATEALTGNSFSANYVLNACQSKNRVSMRAIDLATGQVVWQSIPDLAGNVALWVLPYKLTTYRVEATAISGSTGTIVATASTEVATLDALPCTPTLSETVTTGYWGVYAAIWNATDGFDCGRGDTWIRLRITNMNSGQVELELPNLSPSTMVDFEGPMVSYSTPYHVQAEMYVPATGEILQTASQDVVSAPLR